MTGCVNNINTKIILDTGSGLSIIDQSLVKDNKINYSHNILLTAATGHNLNFIGFTNINLQLGNLIFSHKIAVVKNFKHKILLGSDFFNKSGAVLNYQNNTLILTNLFGEKCVIYFTGHNNYDSVFNQIDIFDNKKTIKKLICARDVKIAPFATKLIKVRTKERVQRGVYIAEKSDDLQYKKGCQIPSALLQLPKNEVYIYIINYTDFNQTIFSGSTIGTLTMLSEEDHISDQPLINNIGVQSDNRLDNLDINQSLHPTEKVQLKRLLDEYSDIMAASIHELGRTDLVEHTIDTGDSKPVRQRPYRNSPKEREEIQKQVNEMLQAKVIRESNSPWSSPVVLVRKSDGRWRFCIDYRKINKLGVGVNMYPLPLIEDVLSCLGGAKYFTILDLFSAFWQVPLKEEDKQKSAFITGDGLYEFNVLPFGLKSASATFQFLADKLLGPLKWKEAIIYLDDIIIFSNTFEQHLDRLRRVLNKIRDAGLKLKISKCQFAYKTLKILGHIISEEGIAVNPEKIKAISEYPSPNSVKKIQMFLGACNFFRKFIKNYSMIARPLYEMTKTDKTKFEWGVEQEKAFILLKEKLTSSPILTHFIPGAEMEIHVDACTSGLGAVLLQRSTNNDLHAISYVSRSLTAAEKNYSVTELEALGCLWSMLKFRHYIQGQKIRIVTDHHALCWLKSIRSPTGRLARWSVKLQDFDYEVCHRKGSMHQLPDALSRNTVPCEEIFEQEIQDIPTYTINTYNYILDKNNIAIFQREDVKLTDIFGALEDEDYGSPALRRMVKNFIIVNGLLCRKNSTDNGNIYLPVIPEKLKQEILISSHDDPVGGHMAYARMYHRIATRYFWFGMSRDINRYVKSCPDCQSRKRTPQRPAGLLHPIPPGRPFEKISMDILGNFPVSRDGNRAIIVATEYSTRYVIAAALPRATAEHVAKFLVDQIILIHGTPLFYLSDNGTVFHSRLVTEIIKLVGGKSVFSTAYNPQFVGLTERFNATICNMISMYVSTKQDDWDYFLRHLVFSCNTTVQTTTGFSSYYLLYGREAILPSEAVLRQPSDDVNVEEFRLRAIKAREIAITNILNKQKKDKARYDLGRRVDNFEVGDLVTVFTPARKVGRCDKLLNKNFGPYKITEKLPHDNYKIQRGHGSKIKEEIVHIRRLNRYYQR